MDRQRVECVAEGATVGEQNGDGSTPKDENISQIVLTFNRAKFQLVPTGSVANYDEALAILEMATRHFKHLLAASQMERVLSAPTRAPFAFPMRRNQ